MILNTEFIVALLTVLLGTQGISIFLFYKERKKTKKLENEALKLQNEITAAEQWQKLFERSDAIVKQKDGKIEELYKDNGVLRDENNSLTTENAVLKLLKCETVGCDKRIPPLANLKIKKNNEQR